MHGGKNRRFQVCGVKGSPPVSAEYIVVLGTLSEPVTVKELVSLVRNSEIEVGDLSIFKKQP
ncbi:hypothetical protein [Desulfosporosinus fructosivorans]|uniref:hypothetical protein n=1 Tax=Desulfosporosinus fructosivorans TaxID=2018669 RepID=UPI001FB18BC9|nr:hypothetical protein [Desulfosporosinus fructosivorans]